MMPEERYKKLKEYLSAENPVLLDVIDKYKALDKIGYNIGLIELNDSYTSHISWWPMISILGTFSAGKSSFLNEYLGSNVQKSGNQAVDDKFTVMSYGNTQEATTLPGLALDADPRFPFYNISEEIDKVDSGDGNRVNQYLQLKTIKTPKIKGKILIDSPGFDADSQRDGILKITKHIVEMSDLVLVFFDARHPEPGAMRDTLEHLVATTIDHKDANKVLYILNQIDTTAKEDNLEAVISSWQRALAKEGLISGNFYAIYNENVAIDIEDESMKTRLQKKKNEDLKEITERMDKVSTERAYRIIKSLEDFSKEIRDTKIPMLQKALSEWGRKVLFADIAVLVIVLILLGAIQLQTGILDIFTSGNNMIFATVGIFIVLTIFHFKIRGFFANRIAKSYLESDTDISKAILHNTKWWKKSFGFGLNWNKSAKNRLSNLMEDGRKAIQKLNDQFVNIQNEEKRD